MAFSIPRNDFFDYFRFFYDEVTLISDFFEETCLKMINEESGDSFSKRKYSVTSRNLSFTPQCREGF